MDLRIKSSRLLVLSLFILFNLSFLIPMQSSGGTIHGVVSNESDRKLSSVRIVLMNEGIETITDDLGVFRIGDISEGSYRLKALLDGYVPLTIDFSLPDETPLQLNVTLQEEDYLMLDDVVVSAAHSVYQKTPIKTATLNSDQVEVLPHFGNDLYHIMGYLPGVVTNDQSSRFSVRGSLPREVLVQFDGVELYEPFHLEDFQGPLSIVDPEVVGSMALTTGGFAAEYGDRSAGLLNIKSMDPEETHYALGLSLSSSWLNSAGRFREGKGSWIFSARRGYLDLLLDIVPQDDDEEGHSNPEPTFYDIYGKFSYILNPFHEITFSFLTSHDSMKWEENEPDEDTRLDSSYGNSYVWIRHEGAFESGLEFDTVLSLGKIDRDRWLYEVEYGFTSDVNDARTVDFWGAKQNWQYDFSPNQLIKWGFEFQRFKAHYDYDNSFDFPISIPDDRFLPALGAYEYSNTFTGEEYTLYLSDRFRLFESLVTEIGLRWDRLSLTDENFLSPRLNALYDLKDKGRFHLGLGYYYQSHRPHELDVQDHETEFHKAEKAEQVSFGYENLIFDTYQLRADVYSKRINNPRPRYENVLDPFNDENPEASPDRVRLDIDTTTARGFEIILSQKTRPKWNWSLYYAFSTVRDKINGVSFYRSTDQPHSFIATGTYRPSSRWNLTAVWNYHTGWPRTEVTAELVELTDGTEDIIPVVGKFYDKRQSSYHRLDLRFSYKKPLKNSELTFFTDIQNAYNRKNVRGYYLTEDSFIPQNNGTVSVNLREEKWLGIIPSFGIKWEF